VGQGHRFDVAFDAMRTHELADGDEFLRVHIRRERRDERKLYCY
jgi:hypothetical protein